jgi:hypothetical protein
VQAFKGDGGLYAQRTLYEKLAPRYQSLMVNSADSPLMKMFEPVRASSLADRPKNSEQKTAGANLNSAAVAEQKGGQQ